MIVVERVRKAICELVCFAVPLDNPAQPNEAPGPHTTSRLVRTHATTQTVHPRLATSRTPHVCLDVTHLRIVQPLCAIASLAGVAGLVEFSTFSAPFIGGYRLHASLLLAAPFTSLPLCRAFQVHLRTDPVIQHKQMSTPRCHCGIFIGSWAFGLHRLRKPKIAFSSQSGMHPCAPGSLSPTTCTIVNMCAAQTRGESLVR